MESGGVPPGDTVPRTVVIRSISESIGPHVPASARPRIVGAFHPPQPGQPIDLFLMATMCNGHDAMLRVRLTDAWYTQAAPAKAAAKCAATPAKAAAKWAAAPAKAAAKWAAAPTAKAATPAGTGPDGKGRSRSRGKAAAAEGSGLPRMGTQMEEVEEALRAREQQMATQMEEVQSLEAAGGLTPETGTSAAPASSSSSSLTPATGTSAAPASTSSGGGLHQTKRAPAHIGGLTPAVDNKKYRLF